MIWLDITDLILGEYFGLDFLKIRLETTTQSSLADLARHYESLKHQMFVISMQKLPKD
jgi:hypothetical protein